MYGTRILLPQVHKGGTFDQVLERVILACQTLFDSAFGSSTQGGQSGTQGDAPMSEPLQYTLSPTRQPLIGPADIATLVDKVKSAQRQAGQGPHTPILEVSRCITGVGVRVGVTSGVRAMDRVGLVLVLVLVLGLGLGIGLGLGLGLGLGFGLGLGLGLVLVLGLGLGLGLRSIKPIPRK